jgi:septal ring factor EnvC (AmiA/AmiB activator)
MTDQNFQIALDTTIRTEVDNLDPKKIIIASQIDRDSVSETINNVRYIRSRVLNFFKDMKENAHKTWKSICSLEKSYTDKCDNFEDAANTAILTYDKAEEAKRQAEERRLQAIKDEEARVKRERLAKEAEEQRQAEAKAKADAEAARQLAEDAEDNSSDIERERLIAEAAEKDRIAAEAAAAARAKESEATQVKAPTVNFASTVTKTAGESVRVVWKARVIDALLVPRAYLMVNEKALDSYAKNTQGENPMPGVEFYTEQIIVRRNK